MSPISRVLSRTAISLVTVVAHGDLCILSRIIGTGRASPACRICSRWGLHCRPPRGGRGGLLPHLFTLTVSQRPTAVRFLLHCPCPIITDGWHYQSPCPAEPGLSSPTTSDEVLRATVWRQIDYNWFPCTANSKGLGGNSRLQTVPPYRLDTGAQHHNTELIRTRVSLQSPQR